MINFKLLIVYLIAKTATSLEDQRNILLEFTDKFMRMFPEEHYASVVYVNQNEDSDFNQYVHTNLIKTTSHNKTFTTHVKSSVYFNNSLVEPCKKHSRYLFKICINAKRACMSFVFWDLKKGREFPFLPIIPCTLGRDELSFRGDFTILMLAL